MLFYNNFYYAFSNLKFIKTKWQQIFIWWILSWYAKSISNCYLKHIKALRDNGYNIESVPRSGYRLIDSPDLLSSEEIKSSLTTKILGSEILYFETVDSTNTQAKK